MRWPNAVPRLVVVTLGLLCMAPTAGDIGGCGAEIKALDPGELADARKRMDCERCRECGIRTARCASACDPARDPDTAIPKTCQPLLHDGEVCIRKLGAASCDAYATYVADVAPSTPSECEFCKFTSGSSPPITGAPTFAVDAGADGAP